MTARRLDNEHDGGGFELYLNDEQGGRRSVFLSFADLASPERMRAAFYAQLGHSIPHYGMDDHAEIVRVLLAAAGCVSLEAAR